MSTLQESPHSETLTVDGEITHAKSWLAPVMAILALVLGLVVGGVLGRSSVDEAGSQPTAAAQQVITDLSAAVNAGDAATIASVLRRRRVSWTNSPLIPPSSPRAQRRSANT